MTAKDDQPPVVVGAALRDARRARRWTLEHVAERSGLSAAFLSRLERGKASSSLSNLIRLSTILEVPLERLFAAPYRPPSVPGGYVLRRGSEGGALLGDVYRYKPLAGGLPHHAISLFELEYAPGQGDDSERYSNEGRYSHEGDEVLYVLEGQIEFTIAGEQVSLRPGDCLQFDGRQPHFGKNSGKVPARMLMILGGPSVNHASMALYGAPAAPAVAKAGPSMTDDSTKGSESRSRRSESTRNRGRPPRVAPSRTG